MQRLLTQVAAGKLQIYMVIVVMFTYSILLSRDFECTCKPQHYDCIIYSLLPALIVTVLMLWSNRLFQRLCSYCCTFKGFLCCQILKSSMVGLLWVALLFVKGDWFACCFNNLSEEQAHLPCKDPGRRTVEERETIAGVKNTSRVVGCWMLFIIIFSGAMSSWIRWKCDGVCKCSRQTAQYEETLYYKLVLEEEEKVLKEVLRQAVNLKLSAEIRKKCEKNWREAFNVADDLITKELQQTVNEETT
ncbi:PREDICTED: uncharacterized protein LOC107104763 [Cyprinodon variegatus]|uniref:uncharacterized protein LOC107104763 n=1 Tax=Cyprinodon variegatus TaxID=28743 RepID=UPI0007429401|nr:PREDICTED: uncharacterized protein LOC107104763 [Cyprinodon variegatus]